jgi:predicted nucleic acid-binding protein
MTAIVIDTNLLVYRLDGRQPAKRRRAHEVLVELQRREVAALTAQVLGEFYRVVTNRLEPPVPAADALHLVGQLVQSFPIWPTDHRVVLEAARGVCDHQLSYWDAQIWASARLNGASLVLSEDFSDGCTMEGVTFRNPFADSFALGPLLHRNG